MATWNETENRTIILTRCTYTIERHLKRFKSACKSILIRTIRLALSNKAKTAFRATSIRNIAISLRPITRPVQIICNTERSQGEITVGRSQSSCAFLPTGEKKKSQFSVTEILVRRMGRVGSHWRVKFQSIPAKIFKVLINQPIFNRNCSSVSSAYVSNSWGREYEPQPG